MGSELVDSPAPHISFTEQFYKLFPFYLSIGMTYEQYWYKDCELVKFYREANEIKNTRKNQELWLQGLYVYQALCDVSPVLHAFAKSGTKPNPYPEKPYPITSKEAKERKEEEQRINRLRAKIVFETWASRLNLPGKEVSDDGNDRQS